VFSHSFHRRLISYWGGWSQVARDPSQNDIEGIGSAAHDVGALVYVDFVSSGGRLLVCHFPVDGVPVHLVIVGLFNLYDGGTLYKSIQLRYIMT
jgi:hypothetical protein